MSKVKRERREKRGDGVSNSKKYMSYFLLVLMVFSIAGFAFITGGGHGGSPNSDNGLPEEVPLQFVEQQGVSGWIAVRNSEYFEFTEIDSLIENREMFELAIKIKEKRDVDLYIDPNFSSLEGIYIIEKALTGLHIRTNRVYSSTCSADTLVLTHDASGLGEDCLVFETVNNETYAQANALVYHLVK